MPHIQPLLEFKTLPRFHPVSVSLSILAMLVFSQYDILVFDYIYEGKKYPSNDDPSTIK
jgi:hypothetical protein